jgi:hypothetical protein
MSREDRPGRSATGLIEPLANDRWPRGVTCRGGFKLLGTPLGFAGAANPGLYFVGNTNDPTPTTGQRILCTPFTAAALGAEQRGLDALTLEFDRKIRLGRMDIRLLPAGLGPGTAQLEIGFSDRKISYCGGVRLGTPLHSPAAEIPECDLLLLDTAPAEPRPPSPRRTADRLARWVAEQLDRGDAPAVVCGSSTAALEAAWALGRAGLRFRACRPLFEMLRRIGPLGYAHPNLHRLEQRWPTATAVLHLTRLWPPPAIPARPRDAVAYVGPGRALPRFAGVGFRLGEGEDRPGLVSYVESTGAKQVALGPRCDDATAALLAKTAVSIFRVEKPTQIPLPF